MSQALRRRTLLGIAWSLALGGAASAQGPRGRLPLPAAVPSGAGQLNVLFDAARIRAGAAVQAPASRAARALIRAVPKPGPGALDARSAAARLHQELVVPVPRETPVYSRTFRFMLAQPSVTDRWDTLILKYARRYRLDARLLKSIMAAESEFNPGALSPAGARGLMQVMPMTALTVGVAAERLHDPDAGIKAGAAYVQVLFKTAWKLFKLKGVRYTDVPYWLMQRVVAAYHAGPKFLITNSWFSSTQAYVRKVALFYQSKVTDLRRPVAARLDFPDYAQTIAPSGAMH